MKTANTTETEINAIIALRTPSTTSLIPNRETTTETRSIDFMNDLGISGSVFVRDLLLNVMTEMINS